MTRRDAELRMREDIIAFMFSLQHRQVKSSTKGQTPCHSVLRFVAFSDPDDSISFEVSSAFLTEFLLFPQEAKE